MFVRLQMLFLLPFLWFWFIAWKSSRGATPAGKLSWHGLCVIRRTPGVLTPWHPQKAAARQKHAGKEGKGQKRGRHSFSLNCDSSVLKTWTHHPWIGAEEENPASLMLRTLLKTNLSLTSSRTGQWWSDSDHLKSKSGSETSTPLSSSSEFGSLIYVWWQRW